MARYVEERTEIQKAEHRRIIAALYLRGKTQASIAAELGLSIATISRDIKVIHADWLKETRQDFDALKARELEKINEVEREAWESWRQSKEEKVITATKKVTGESGRNEASVKKEKRAGDTEYLRLVQWAIEQRCKIFGFYAPTRLTIEEMDRIINQLGVRESKEDGSADSAFIN